MSKTLKPNQPAARILVVEDEGELGLWLNIVLAERNLDLDYVSNLLAASEYLEKHKPAIIILDNKLPDGYGVDFITFIRKKHPASKIIMLTGYAAIKDVALANGADRFFEKPFDLDAFNKAMDELLN
ncbi:MAG: response regulator [Sphingobacteriales bacterium]|nr:MAG: response regulator [Sphingobacteriales bacterium]